MTDKEFVQQLKPNWYGRKLICQSGVFFIVYDKISHVPISTHYSSTIAWKIARYILEYEMLKKLSD